MKKVSLKDILKNPANVILLFIFFISIVVGFLFVFRIFYKSEDNASVAMKELDDSLDYYVSSNQVDINGAPAKDIALILDGNNRFNLILNTEQSSGFTGIYVQNDNVIYLFTDYYYTDKSRNEYRLFTLNIQDDNTLVLTNSLNNVSNYILGKVNSSSFKSKGYNSLTVKPNSLVYTYNDNDDETINVDNYNFESAYKVIKFIYRLDYFTPDYLPYTLYKGRYIPRRNVDAYEILGFILPNIPESKFTSDVINTISSNVFRTNINYYGNTEILYKGNKYIFNNDRYEKVEEDIIPSVNQNVIKKVYNYELQGDTLLVDEIVICYECNDGVCKFYPFHEINDEVKNYYDFTTSSISNEEVLKNINKINHYTWTFKNENNNYYFDSISYN